jgi:hypothetical protein
VQTDHDLEAVEVVAVEPDDDLVAAPLPRSHSFPIPYSPSAALLRRALLLALDSSPPSPADPIRLPAPLASPSHRSTSPRFIHPTEFFPQGRSGHHGRGGLGQQLFLSAGQRLQRCRSREEGGGSSGELPLLPGSPVALRHSSCIFEV